MSTVGSTGSPPGLGEVIARLSALLGSRQGSVTPLAGGITNRNFKVDFGGTDYVLRLPGKDTEELGIDRDAECDANQRAAELGIAPRVITMMHDPQCIVTCFVTGSTATAEQLREPANLTEVARALRAFHDSGVTLRADFNSFRIVEEYADAARAHSVELPAGYEPARACAHAIERALSTHPEHAPVPCHNDLLAANFILGGERLQIVDWEYAGMGDRHFDLGNFAVNNELDESDERRLLEAYFGEPPGARRLAALKLMRYMSDFREAMWGVVQSGISELDFDFRDYGRAHFERLATVAADPRFEGWIEEAGGSSA